MNRCPKCRTETLLPVQSAAGLSTMQEVPRRCARCRGFWVRLAAVAALRDSGALETLDADETVDESHDRRNGLCPDGHGILLRARASWTRPFFVERCGDCDGIWLDAGEWRRLGAEHLLQNVEDLWLPSRRRRMREEHSASRMHQLLDARLGSELLARIESLADELADHPHGDMGVAQLRELFDARRPRTRRK